MAGKSSTKVWTTCADPLGQHSRKLKKDKTFSKVTVEYAEERKQCVPSLWESVQTKDTWLCKLCIWKINNKHSKCHPPVQDFSSLSLDSSAVTENDKSDPEFVDISTEKNLLSDKLHILGVDSTFLKTKSVSKKAAAQCIAQLREQYELLSNQIAKIAGIENKLERTDNAVAVNSSILCKVCEDTLINLAKRFQEVNSKEDKYRILTCAPSLLTLDQTVKTFGCTQYMARQANELKRTEGFYSCPSPRLGRTLSEAVKDLVVQFYESDEHSRVDPSTRSALVKKKAEGSGVVGKAKRHILLSLADLYSLFKEQYPETAISISAFAKLRPLWCRFPGKTGHHLSCTCMMHENFKLMTIGMNVKLTTTQIVSALVCNSDSETCCFNVCAACPKNDIVKGWLDSVSYDEVTYNFWGNMQGFYGTNLFEKTECKHEFKERFFANLPELLAHHYVMKKQYAYMDIIKSEVLPNENSSLVQVDFAQNYPFTVQNAVQGYHWSNNQATLHPFVFTWFDKPLQTLMTKSYVVVSDHLIHDADTFFAFRDEIIKIVKSEGRSFEKLYYVSDGAGSQYKNKKNFANLLCHEQDYGIKAEWHFFPTSHGKGPCDGVGAVVKKVCTTGSLKIDPKTKSQIYIRSSSDVAEYAGNQLNGDKIMIVYIPSSKVTAITQTSTFRTRYDSLKSIAGTRAYHSFIPRDGESLEVRRYSLAKDCKLAGLKMSKSTEGTRFKTDDYVGIKLGSAYAVGVISNIVEGCYHIQLFKHRKRRNEFYSPDNPNIQPFPEEQIIMKIRHMECVGTTYKLGSSDYKALESSISSA